MVLLNPDAKHPLPENFFGTTAQDVYENGNIHFFVDGPYTYASITEKFLCPREMVPFYRVQRALAMEEWLRDMHELRPGMEAVVVQAHRNRTSK